ncbi:CaiF/GrlA family transcriptional regulator [Escherichia coli]|uniref:CaiF/GrlA family transcriptional regulator n=1 Tax=Escherichia coli TaxID=562 RepID=UPI000CFC075F
MIKRHSYQIPESVSDISEQPLYILIASWGLRNKKILTTDIVAKKFFITQRRAMDIMHYIKTKGEKMLTLKKSYCFTGSTRISGYRR